MAGTKIASGSVVSGVAGRFASALLEVGEETKSVDAIASDLDRFDALIAANADLQRLVGSPVFTAEEQARAVGAILDKAGIGGLAGNFIRLVAAKRRLYAIRDMVKAYHLLVAAKRGIRTAEVVVAEEPSKAVLDDIKAALVTVAGSDVVLDLKVEPAIIGGIIVKLGSRMVDASLRSKLNSLRLAMKEVG